MPPVIRTKLILAATSAVAMSFVLHACSKKGSQPANEARRATLTREAAQVENIIVNARDTKKLPSDIQICGQKATASVGSSGARETSINDPNVYCFRTRVQHPVRERGRERHAHMEVAEIVTESLS